MSENTNPLTAAPPTEIPLPRAPLVRVVAQVRFPLIASVEKREFIASFQEAIRKEYPVLRHEKAQGFVLGPKGATLGPESAVWRFSDAGTTWRASLAPDFVALETTAYQSRKDMLDRVRRLLKATQDHVDPQMVDRIGLRYIDRVSGDKLSQLKVMLHPQVAGVLNTEVGESAVHSLSESIFALPGSTRRILARWGIIPGNTTFDANVIEAIPEKSWILDLDVYDDQSRPFETEALVKQTEEFAERGYSFFRWVVTERFLREYGA